MEIVETQIFASLCSHPFVKGVSRNEMFYPKMLFHSLNLIPFLTQLIYQPIIAHQMQTANSNK